MRWFKRITVTLVSLLIFIILTVSLLLLILENDNYRNFSVSLVEHYTNLKININGPFALDVSLTPRIQTSSIQLSDINNNFVIDIGHLKVEVDLYSLVFSNFRINNLQLDDINITLNNALFDNISSVELTQDLHHDEKLLLPVVENLVVRNLVLNIEQKTSTISNYASITQVKLGFDENQSHHTLEGTGQVNGFEFETKGSFGKLSELLVTNSFPIDATARIANMKISLKGEIQDPINGTGLNLVFDASTNDFLKVFRNNSKLPFIGTLKAHANINGDLPNIAIENVNLKLENTNKTLITISGSLPELKTGKNTYLKITSKLNDPAIYNWLIPSKWPKIKSITANTVIKNNVQGDYTLNNIQLISSIADDVKLNATGSAVIKNISKHPLSSINLLLTANAATAKSLQKFISREIPDLGVIKATAQLLGSEEHLSIKDIVITSGTPDKLFVQAKGSIQNISLRDNYPVTGIDIKLSAQAKNIKTLESILKKTLPDLENIKFSSELYDNKKMYSLKNIKIISGTKKHTDIEISGKIDDLININGLVLNAKFDIKTKKLLHVIKTSKDLPNPGTTKGKFLFQRENNFYSIDDVDVSIIKSNAWRFTAKGNIAHLLSDRKFSLNTSSSITDWTDLRNILNRKKLDFKAESGTGVLSGDKNNITFNNTFSIGKTNFNFGLTVKKQNNRYKVKTNLESSLLYLEDFGVKPKEIVIEDNKTKSNNNKDIVSDKTIPFNKLDIIDLTAKLKLDKISGYSGPLVGLDVNLVLDNGNLRIHPANLNYTDGSIKLDLGISGNKNHDSYLKLNIVDVDLGSIMSQIQTTPIVTGSLNSIISLQSSGDSLQKIVKNSSGDITIVGENIKVLRKYTNLLVNDTLGWASSSIGLAQQYTTLSCSIFKFNVSNKKIQSEALIVDGPDMRINGDLEINLNNETIDMKLWPKQKNTLWLNVNPVTLTGPIRDPVANTLAVGTSNVARTYGELYFATIFIPLRALTYVSNNFLPFLNSDGPCQELEREILEKTPK